MFYIESSISPRPTGCIPGCLLPGRDPLERRGHGAGELWLARTCENPWACSLQRKMEGGCGAEASFLREQVPLVADTYCGFPEVEIFKVDSRFQASGLRPWAVTLSCNPGPAGSLGSASLRIRMCSGVGSPGASGAVSRFKESDGHQRERWGGPYSKSKG